jgi:hypothetical protein
MAEVQGARLSAERELAQAAPDGELSAEQVRQLVASLEDIPRVLANADPKAKAKVYAELGIAITYHPAEHRVVAESSPAFACATARVGGGT